MDFLKQVLSADGGRGSFSRLSGAAVIVALIVWASVLTVTTETIHDIPVCWLALVLGLYGINKVADGATSIAAIVKGKPDVQPPEKPAA
jgi:hypothetical protein